MTDFGECFQRRTGNRWVTAHIPVKQRRRKPRRFSAGLRVDLCATIAGSRRVSRRRNWRKQATAQPTSHRSRHADSNGSPATSKVGTSGTPTYQKRREIRRKFTRSPRAAADGSNPSPLEEKRWTPSSIPHGRKRRRKSSLDKAEAERPSRSATAQTGHRSTSWPRRQSSRKR